MTNRIYISEIWRLMENRKTGEQFKFSISYIKRSTGEIVHYPEAILTSFHSKGSTINVLPAGEVRPRKIRRCLIVMFNNQIVYC
jgi:hypothetical protein